MFEIEGKVKVLFDTQTMGSKGFTKREFVITTREKYPQDVKIECTMDRTSLLDQVSVGNDVQVKFNIRGNEYNDRYYVNLQAWSITVLGAELGTSGAADAGAAGNTSSSMPPAAPFNEDDLAGADDDLPF